MPRSGCARDGRGCRCRLAPPSPQRRPYLSVERFEDASWPYASRADQEQRPISSIAHWPASEIRVVVTSITWPGNSAPSQPSTTSVSRCIAAPFSACWAPTEPARPRPSDALCGCCPQPMANCAWLRRRAARTGRRAARTGLRAQKFSLTARSLSPKTSTSCERLWIAGAPKKRPHSWAIDQFEVGPHAGRAQRSAPGGFQATPRHGPPRCSMSRRFCFSMSRPAAPIRSRGGRSGDVSPRWQSRA